MQGSGKRFRLQLEAGPRRQYRLAQLDDYGSRSRRQFPHESIDLRLQARVSARLIPGTWGFGVWNDAFGLNLGGTGSAFRLPALPNAAWFFHASGESYLSLRDDLPANGLMAQVFRSPVFAPDVVRALVTTPFSPRLARRILRGVVWEDSRLVSIDPTAWHDYHLLWRPTETIFEVDGASILRTRLSPNGRAGFVLWIDNQFAAFTPLGKVAFGTLSSDLPVWLETESLAVART